MESMYVIGEESGEYVPYLGGLHIHLTHISIAARCIIYINIVYEEKKYKSCSKQSFVFIIFVDISCRDMIALSYFSPYLVSGSE